MRILVISDIHSNLTALETIISDAGICDETWCLGDLVGYGPDPNECIRVIRQLPNLKCIIGNHDAAVLEKLDTDTFNNDAKKAIDWTRDFLSSEGNTFLQSLPETLEMDLVTLVHGSPHYPVWEYLLDIYTATQNFEYFRTTFCFVGHTHFPVIFHQPDKNKSAILAIPEPGIKYSMPIRSILNPGSAGQPRDRDPRASYAIYYPEQQIWENCRVAYDIKSVQERMAVAHLPEKHIQRLAGGW